MRLLRSNRYVCEHTHAAYTYSYNDSLCSWISLLRHRVDDRTSHAGSTQTGFSFYHVRLFFFFFLNSFTILVFLTLTLPNPNPLWGVHQKTFLFWAKKLAFSDFQPFLFVHKQQRCLREFVSPTARLFQSQFYFFYFFKNVFFKCSFKLKMTLVFLSEAQ